MPKPSNDIKNLIAFLTVPEEYACIDTVDDQLVLDKLEDWKQHTHSTLFKLQSALPTQSTEGEKSSNVVDQANVAAAIAVFVGTGPWIDDASRDLAQAILDNQILKIPVEIGAPTIDTKDQSDKRNIIRQVLMGNVKPWFRSNPHPYLNTETGKKIGRAAGGPMASQDYYESQTWKRFPGASNVVAWCIQNIEPDEYGEMWHLVIPPIMALLDDYEPKNKLRGVKVVFELFRFVPKELLKRTGIDELIHTSLKACLAHLNNSLSADMIQVTIPTHLKLIELTTSPGSAERFNKLSALLGEGIIGGVWLYSSDDRRVMLASLKVLVPLVQDLGVGTARFLKGLMTQLMHFLMPNNLNPIAEEMQVCALNVIEVLMEYCAMLMHRWAGPLLNSITRCWVDRRERLGADNIVLASELEVDKLLLSTCKRLAKAWPPVQEDYERLMSADRGLFGPLFVGSH